MGSIDTEMLGLEEDRATKRRLEGGKTREGDAAEAAEPAGSSGDSSMERLRKIQGNLPDRLGEGEYEKSLLEGMALCIRDIQLEQQEMKSCLVSTWEMPKESVYVEGAMKMKDLWQGACKASRGTGKNLGHPKLYTFMGLYQALLQDAEVPQTDKQACEDALGHRLRTNNKLDPGKARELEALVGYCMVKRYKKTAYVNILLREVAGMEIVYSTMKDALDRVGRRDYSGGIPSGLHKELKEGLAMSRKGGKGGGK